MSLGTGHGSALAFGTQTGFTPTLISIDAVEQTRDKLSTTGLATTGVRSYIPEDLGEPGELAFSYYIDAEVAHATGATASQLPAFTSEEVITVTLKITDSGNSDAADYSLDGFCIARTLIPELATNSVMMGSATYALSTIAVFDPESV